jgi:DNA-binding NarL/FixJ family response regulator
MSTKATRVVLADDEVLMREGLAGLLERSGFEVVGQCGTASELIDLVRELRPDTVLGFGTAVALGAICAFGCS